MANVIEINARRDAGQTAMAFEHLAKREAIIVLRDVPEIHELGAAIRRTAARLGGPAGERDMAVLMETSEVTNLEALSLFYRSFRHLRDSRYVSGLFAGLVGALGLPAPILIDSGYCRMVVPNHHGLVRRHLDMFAEEEAAPPHPNEAESMIRGQMWGAAHRDIDSPHVHYQVNLWFPLHDVDERRTLLLFPDVYRHQVPQYGKLDDPDDPDGWGFGRALRVPLRFGDTLLFHSQQLHASPSQSTGSNRFSVELRVASGCVDDNARMYRRLFWKLENFQPAKCDSGSSAFGRTNQLAADIPPGQPDLAWVLEGQTAHAVFHRLFPVPKASLDAGYILRPDEHLDQAAEFDDEAWARIVARLEELPAGEDLLLATARLLILQGFAAYAAKLLARIYGHTTSYFWALEAGRIAAEAGLYDVAEAAYTVAGVRAGQSDVSMSRFTAGIPLRGGGVAQLLPDTAKRAAAALLRRVQIDRAAGRRQTPTYNHRLFQPFHIAASFEHFDIIKASDCYVANPAGYAFEGELILERGGEVVLNESEEEVVRALGDRLGKQLPQPRPSFGPIISLDEYLIQQVFGAWYVTRRKKGGAPQERRRPG